MAGKVSAIQQGRARPHSDAGFRLTLLAMVAILAGTVLIGVSVGAVTLPLGRVWQVVGSHLFGDLVQSDVSSGQDRIIWQFRVPRALLGVVVGAGLSVVGVALQVTVRNQLADPFILGVTSGASFGAVLVIVLGSAAVAGVSLSAAAFIGAVATLLAVYLLARRDGTASPARWPRCWVARSWCGSTWHRASRCDPRSCR